MSNNHDGFINNIMTAVISSVYTDDFCRPIIPAPNVIPAKIAALTIDASNPAIKTYSTIPNTEAISAYLRSKKFPVIKNKAAASILTFMPDAAITCMTPASRSILRNSSGISCFMPKTIPKSNEA